MFSVFNARTDYRCTVRIAHLRKEFNQSLFRKSKLDKVAVKNTCLTLQEGKLLALLGQNGAGKSTTMNILAGLTPASNGDALFYGQSVRDNMQEIRKNLGVCPQHDILFNDLTSREHFYLYCGIKNVPYKDIPALMEERLKAVRLWKVADKRAGTYSGGYGLITHPFNIV
jgi:ABC-type multidrug transport system ATPase subunit